MATNEIWSPANMHERLRQWKENKRGDGTKQPRTRRPLTNKKKKRGAALAAENDENFNMSGKSGNAKVNKFGFRKKTPVKKEKRKTPEERTVLGSAKKCRTPKSASVTVAEIAAGCLPAEEETLALLKKKVCVGLRKHELSKKLTRLQKLIKETRGSYNAYLSGVRTLVEKCQQREAALATNADEVQAQNAALAAGRADLEHTISNLREEQKTRIRNMTELIDSKKALSEQHAQLLAKAANVEEDLKLSRQSNTQLDAEIEQLRGELATKKTAYETLAAEFATAKADMQSTVARMQQEQTEHQEKVEAEMEAKVRVIQEQLSAENTKAQVLAAQRTGLEEQIKKLDSAYSQSVQAKEQLQGRVSELTVTEGRQAAQIEGLENALAQLKQEITSKEQTFQQSMTNFNMILSQNEARQARNDSEKDELNTKMSELTSSYAALQASSRDLESKCSSLESQLVEAVSKGTTASTELATAMQQLQAQEDQLTTMEQKHNFVVHEFDMAKSKFEESRLAWEDSHSMLTAQVDAGEKAMTAIQVKLRETEHALTARDTQLELTEQQVKKLENETKTLREGMSSNVQEVMEKVIQMSQDREQMTVKLSSHDNLQRDFEASQSEIHRLQRLLMESETARRKLHNRVQELRGNIRVFVRVRPFLPGDGAEFSEQQPSMRCMADGQSMSIKDRNKDHKFAFDRVFERGSSQGAVFGEVSELVQSALDGYNVCIFSYGQTGSGKTYTMQGLLDDHEQRGLIPRSMEQILAASSRMSEQGWRFEFNASFVEIYNEQVRDLLRTTDQPVSCDIKRNAKGKTFVAGSEKMPMRTMEDVGQIMRLAATKRAVGCTSMNSVSSRSHSVFTIFISGTCAQHNKRIVGALNLCDLAGSERLARSKATGAQLKETQAINKSLSALADVFMALKAKQRHIPYRNSKLTYLLEPCFSKDGKTMMLVNVSPTQLSAQETTCSLRFAQQVNQCELGKATAQVQDLSSKGSGKASGKGQATAGKPEKTRGSTRVKRGRIR